jgi:hypothetical protein
MNFVFTQCAAVLLDRAPVHEELEKALAGWNIVGPQEAAPGDDGWVASSPGFILGLVSGGSVVVDMVGRPWPDTPRAADEAVVAAWRGGLFGPSAAPGALARAREQSWSWQGGAEVALAHKAFIRLRTVVGLSEGGTLPRGHDPLHELTTLTELGGDLLRISGAGAFFLPGGEALRSPAQVEAVRRIKAGLGGPPLELWTNTRAMGLGQHGGRPWVLLDVVGMAQLRLPDQEAVFVEGAEEPDAVAPLLHNACLHVVNGKGIGDGSTADDGRRRRWRARSAANGLLAPGRPVVRWTAEESPAPEPEVMAELEKLRRS